MVCHGDIRAKLHSRRALPNAGCGMKRASNSLGFSLVTGCAIAVMLGCVPFRSGPPRECPIPPNHIQPPPSDRPLTLEGVYRIITVDISRDRHHPKVISGKLTLTRPDTTRPYYWETARGLERGPAPALVGILVWDKPMRGYAQDSVIAAFAARSSLRSGHCLTCWDPHVIDYHIFDIKSTGFTGWWAIRRTAQINYDPGPTKEERRKMVPDPRGYFCAKRV